MDARIRTGHQLEHSKEIDCAYRDTLGLVHPFLRRASPEASYPLFLPIQTHRPQGCISIMTASARRPDRPESRKGKNMARYAIRESLRMKFQEVLDKAAAKEGREVTETRISMDEKLEVFAKSDGYMLLSDGRYVYDVWNSETKRDERYVVDNVPVAVLKELFICLHDENLQERDKKENEYVERRAPWQDDDDDSDCDVCDRIPMNRKSDNPETIVMKKLFGDSSVIVPADLSALGDDPEIGYSKDGKHFDMKTMRQLRSIALAYTESLPEDKRQQFDMLYACGAVQKDLADYWGISEPAVSKRAHEHIKKASRIFAECGYPVPTKEDLKQEKKAREAEQGAKKAKRQEKSTKEHYDAAAECIADIYLADYDESDMTA